MAQTINAGKIQYGIGFQIDKSGLNELKTQLQQLSNMSVDKYMSLGTTKATDTTKAQQELNKLKQTVNEVQKAYANAFNSTTGTMNLNKFSQSLKNIGVGKIATEFKSLGVEGVKAFNEIATATMGTSLKLRETHNVLDKMKQTLANTLKWQISSSMINRFTGAVQQAYGYVQHLDTSLNDIRIVTGKSADEMERFARTANKAAKSLGASTTEYTEAALIYYQQGLSDKEANARAATTLKAANVTGQSGAAVSEELTAVWNGYKVSAEETELAVDKLAAVAATTAADLEELSVGMSKVASAANNMGVDMDQLNAQIATIVSVTRQAPESVGTALKTIYARMSDLQLGGADEDDITLGKVSGTLEKVGISILDTNGDLREMGNVIEEVAGKWDTWTKAQQAAVAQSLAGKRQYNNLVSLFDNWDMYEKALDTSRNSMGTLQKQQDIYMESTEAHLQVLQTQWEDLYDSLLDTDSINSIIDLFTKFLSVITQITDSMGGMKGVFLGLSSLILKTFSKNIGGFIGDSISKKADRKYNKALLELDVKNAQEAAGAEDGTNQSKFIANQKQEVQKYYKYMTDEEKKAANDLIISLSEEFGKIDEIEAKRKEEIETLKTLRKEHEEEIKNAEKNVEQAKDKLKTEKEKLEIAKEQLKIAQQQKQEEAQQKFEEKQQKNIKTLQQDGSQFGLNLTDNFDENKEKIQKNINKYKTSAKQGGISDYLDSGFLTEYAQGFTTQIQELTTGNKSKETIKSEVDKILKDYSSMETALREAGREDLLEYYNNVYKAVEKYDAEDDESVAEVEKALSDFEEKFDKKLEAQIKRKLNKKLKDLENLEQKNENYQNQTNEGPKVSSQKTEEEKNAEKEISNLEKNIKSSENEVDKMQKNLEKIKDGTDAIEDQEEVVQGLTNDYNRMANSAEEAAVPMGELKKKLKAKQLGADISKLVSGFTMMMYSAQGAKQVVQSFGDGDVLGGLMSLGTTILPSVISGFSQLINGGPLEKIAGGLELIGSIGGVIFESMTFDYFQDLELAADQAEEAAQKQEELIQKEKEEKEAIDKLAFSYQNIYDLKNKQGELDENQKSQLENLINEYEDEHLKLLLLIEDYEGLEKAIRDKQAAERGEYIEENKKGIESSFKAILAAGHDDGLLDYLDLTDNDAEEIRDRLGEALLSKEDIENASSVNGLMNTLMKKMEDPQNAEKTIQTLKELKLEYKKYSSAFDDMILRIQDNTQGYNESLVLDNIDFKAITNSDEFEKALKEAGQFKGVNGQEIGEEFAKNIMKGYSDQMAEFASQGEVKNEIFDVITPSEENLDFYKSLSEDDRVFLYSNKELAADSENLKKFFETYQTEYNRTQNEKNKRAVEDLFEHIKTTKKGEADFKLNTKEGKELVSNLYSTGDFEEFTGISEEDFFKQDFSQQQQELSEYYHNLYKEEENFRAFQQGKIKENLADEEKAIRDKQIIYNNFITDFKKKYEDKIPNLSEILNSGMTASDVDNLFIPEESKEKLKKVLIEFEKGLKENGFELMSTGEQAEYFENQLKSVTAMTENAEDAIYSFTPELESYNGVMHDINSEIDSLQSSYQTLQGVVEDYNDDQKLTLDNLQKVLEMDELYLATLEFENGQLKINESSYETMIQAKIKEAQMTATQTFMTELLAIKNGEAADAGLVFTERQYQEAEALRAMANEAYKGIDALMKLTEVQDAAKVNATATENSVKAYYARMQLISTAASQDVSTLLSKTDKNSKSNKPSHEKYLEREHDIYKKINEELNHIEKTLTKIDTIENHSWGVSYLDALQEQNKLLDKQLEKLEEKKALQVGDLSTRKKQLEDLGINFAEGGAVMTNSEDVLDALYESYNKNYVDKFNAMSKDEQENFKLEKEQEEDRIKKIEKAVGEYEKLYGEYEDIQKQLQDLYYKQIEKDVEEFNFEINLELELSDARKEWKDFWHDVVKDVESDDFVGQIAKSFSKLGELIGVGGSSNNDVLGLTQHLKETLDEVNTQITTHGLDGLFGTDTKLSEENLTNYRDKLMSALKDAKEEIENISDNYLSMLESAQDMIDKQVEGWENIGDQINHNLELIKLISGENTYDALAKQYEQQYDNNLQTIEAQRIGRDYWKEKIAEYKTLLAAAEEGTEEYKTLQKALDTSTEKYIEANKELNSTVEESIKNLQEWRKNSVSAITEVLDKAMSGGLGTDMLEQEWKLINDYADQYFDNVERAVNMEEYTNILQDAANATGLTAKNQEKINKFMDEELKKLNEKEKLTQYDIDESKARLEILKAEMALQDAQRNKSNMRLRRDNQGNYTYQYTGNEQAIEDAEKAGLTARKAWYELVKKRNKETNDYIIQLEKDRISIMNQLDEAELAGDEERANKLKELLNRNEEQIVFAYGEAQKTKQDLFSGTAQYFADVENAEILPMWDATVTQLVDRFAGDNKDSFITACKNAINELDIVQERYVEKTQRILNTAGIEYQKLVEEGIDPTKEAIEELNGTNEELAEGLDDTNEKLEEMRGYLEECAQAYRDFKDDAVSAIQEANQALETLARTHMDTINQINSTPINSAIYAPAIQGNLGYNENSSGGAGSGNNVTADNALKNLLNAQARKENRGTIGSEIQVEAGSGRVVASSNNVDKKSVQNAVNNAIANNPNITYLKSRGSVAVNSAGEWFIKDQYAADIIKEWLKSKGFKFLNDGQIGYYVGSNNVNFGTPQQQTQKTALQTVTESYNTSKENKTAINKNGLTSFPLEDTISSSDSDIGEDFLERIKKKKGYKSGGYTGDWSGQGVDGMGGRMAVLHQKELVLNESDTSNMLAAVEALRQMNIDKLAQSILATSIATAQMQIQTQLLSAQLSGLRDQYESSRNTTINADFSGVRTADEILRAFEELENYGLQQYNTGDASYRSY